MRQLTCTISNLQLVERPAGQARDLGGKLDTLTPFMPGRRAHSTAAQRSPGVLALSNWIVAVCQHVSRCKTAGLASCRPWPAVGWQLLFV